MIKLCLILELQIPSNLRIKRKRKGKKTQVNSIQLND